MSAGERLDHRLYHFRLAFSGWEHAHGVLGGKSFVALAEGLQSGLWGWVGSGASVALIVCRPPSGHLDRHAQEDLTRRYEELCAHYGMMPTRNNRGIAHQNGAIESAHGHLKKAIGFLSSNWVRLLGALDLQEAGDAMEAFTGQVDFCVHGINAGRKVI